MFDDAMELALAKHLSDTLSPDATTRAEAERALEAAVHDEGYATSLLKIALAPIEEHTRQLAAVILKKCIREHWSRHDRLFVAPEISANEKAVIKQALPSGLGETNSKIRTAMAMAIAQVAVNEWPGEWPELTTTLVDGIRARRSKAEVLGCLKCYEMIANDMDEVSVAAVGPVLFPELLTLARVAEHADVKRRATSAFAATVSTLENLSGSDQRAVRDSLVPYLGNWLETVATALERVPNPKSFEQCAASLEALKSLVLAVTFFAKPAGDALMPALSRGAALFHGIAPVYAQYAEENDHATDGNDSDGDEVSFDAVATELLELIITISEQPKLHKILAPSLTDTLYVTIGYMSMSSAQEEQWIDDPNQYVADEDDDFSTLRASCGLMLDSLCLQFGPKAVTALADVANRRMSESIAARNAGDEKWWRIREATLLAVGTMSDAITTSAERAQQKGLPVPFDLSAFLQTVIDVDLHESTAQSAPFLRGRALWVAARVSSGVPANMAGTILSASVQSLAPGLAAPLRIGACRAIAEFIPLAKPDVLAPHIGNMYKGLGGLLGEVSEETLHLVLEALLVLIKADGAAASAWLNALAPATVKIWAEHVTDPLLSADTCEIFEALAAVPTCQPQLHSMLVPTLAQVLSAPDSQPPMLVEATLDLLAIILRPAELAEAKATHEACFKYVHGLIMRGDDAGVMQGAAECLRAFLRAGNESMLEWGTGDASIAGGDVLRAMFETAARLLDPTLEDSASLYAAPLLCQMLRRLPTKVGPVLRDITSAVVARLRSSTQPNLSASLLSIFARIVHFDANAFIDLLSSLPSGGDEPNAFDFVMRRWVEIQPDVHGAFDIKLTTSALGLLLNTHNAALGAVTVRGQIVETPAESGRIRTRARAVATGPEVWTQIPLPVKIVELLADVLLEYAEGAAGAADEDEWEEDDDDVDGFDDDDNDGGDNDDYDFGAEEKGFTGDLFERLLMRGGLDAFDPDDADEAEDPVNDIDLAAFITAGVKSLHASGHLAPLAHAIPERHQRAIHDALVRA